MRFRTHAVAPSLGLLAVLTMTTMEASTAKASAARAALERQPVAPVPPPPTEAEKLRHHGPFAEAPGTAFMLVGAANGMGEAAVTKYADMVVGPFGVGSLGEVFVLLKARHWDGTPYSEAEVARLKEMEA